MRLLSSARELLETCWELLDSCYFHSPAVFLLCVGDGSEEPDCGTVKEALLTPSNGVSGKGWLYFSYQPLCYAGGCGLVWEAG